MALTFGTAEAVCRLTERHRPPPPPVAADITDWGDLDFYTLKSAATGWPPWEDYNSDGVRDREHAVAKPPGIRRVLCLGDSVTLGFGLRPEEAYPQILQDRLDARGRSVEVFNLALGGWATRQERIAYERIGRKYQPDLVLLAICLNDVAELHNNLTRPPRLVQALFRHSALVRRAMNVEGREIRTIRELFRPEAGPNVEAGYRRMFDEIRRLSGEVRADGARLALVVLPTVFQVQPDAPPPLPQQRIAAFAREEKLPLVDLLPPLGQAGGEAFTDAVHLSPLGMRRVAEELADSTLLADAEASARPEPPHDSPDSPRRANVGAWVTALHDKDAASRAGAARALGNAALEPSVSVPALTRALGDPAADVRAAAAWGLGGFGPEAASAKPSLVARLEDPAPGVRAGAAWALGRIRAADEGARLALIRLLQDTDQSVRWRASDALLAVGVEGPACRSALMEVLARNDGPGRAGAAAALGALGPSARPAVPLLIEALADARAEVRGRVAWALGRVGPDAHEAVPTLITLLDDANVGWRAADALGAIGPAAREATPSLARALGSPSGSLRWRAAEALGDIGPGAAASAPALAKALADAEENVRLAAAKALVRIHPDARAVVPALADGLRDSDFRVRAESARALGRLDAAARPAVPALLGALRDPEPGVRAAAGRALQRIDRSPQVVTAVTRVMNDDPDEFVRSELRKALRPAM